MNTHLETFCQDFTLTHCEIAGLSRTIDSGSAESSCNDEGVRNLTVSHSRQKEDRTLFVP